MGRSGVKLIRQRPLSWSSKQVLTEWQNGLPSQGGSPKPLSWQLWLFLLLESPNLKVSYRVFALKHYFQQLITWFVLRRRAQLIVKTQCELHNLFTGYSNAHDSHWVISLTVFPSGFMKLWIMVCFSWISSPTEINDWLYLASSLNYRYYASVVEKEHFKSNLMGARQPPELKHITKGRKRN